MRTIHYHEGTGQQDPRCVNLVKTFGEEFRITWDEAYTPEYKSVSKNKRDVWYAQIPCKYGTIYPYGGDLLAVEVDNKPSRSKPLADLFVIQQDGGFRLGKYASGEMTYHFHVKDFDKVAEIVKPRKRRRLTEEQKARLATCQTPEERAANLERARASRTVT